ncbi:MAG TPA: malate dehydrogenase [Candidatus Margulisiibacteriota bacterium]|nr:malate dehydrogenase [Candidatus Margulisiibacteriota bacterium]
MKISVIGAGNVGSLAAMRLAQDGLGEIFLVDIVKGLAKGKSLDLEDARSILKLNYQIQGSEDINDIKGSDIIVITAGLARKPGMTREELLLKNSEILKSISSKIKESAPKAIVIVVTNPLDLMTYFVLKSTGFPANRVLGMGLSLDASRFANLIAAELKIPVTDIDACVIGSHGEGMLPLPAFTRIKGVPLDEVVDEKKVAYLIERTVKRGAEIVSFLGNGSAFFAPSAAISSLVKAIVKNEKKTIGVCAYLNGEYGIKGVCIGLPCRIGNEGIEEIIELKLSREELLGLKNSTELLRKLTAQLPL